MTDTLSPNTKAILLLTAPLIVGRGNEATNLLTPGEYKKLARHLRERGRKPADLLAPDAESLLEDCRHVIDKHRLKDLLNRGLLLSQAVERWQARAIWVVSRADPTYPQRLKARLKENSPAVLYGCGERDILDTGGLAVVGSRHVDEDLVAFTEGVGSSAAKAKQTLVSGGARGIDQAAMRGALEAGGRVAGVLADSLEKTAMNRDHRNLVLEGQLVLVSPYDPSAGFNVGHAMQRNKLIYALADAALVVNADFNKGGTWAGAKEQLDKLHLVPVYVRNTAEANKGLEALRKKGALVWPDPGNEDEFVTALSAEVSAQVDLYSSDTHQTGTVGQVRESPTGPTILAKECDQYVAAPGSDPAKALFATVRLLALRMLEIPRNAADVAAELGVTKKQAEEWLQQLVNEGVIEKHSNPVRYVARQGSRRRPGLRQ